MYTTDTFKFNSALLNWALGATKKDGFDNYLSGIKKQKFLFFYNLFAYLSGVHFTFDTLKAYANGPVYYDIYSYSLSDNHKFYGEYVSTITKYQKFSDLIDFNIAKISFYLVNSMTNDQVSDLTHHFDFWKNSRNTITTNINLGEMSQKDYDFASWLLEFWTSMVEDHQFIKGVFNTFYLSKSVYTKIKASNPEFREKILSTIKNKFDYNPVVISLDDKEELLID